jgi:hypothetical protein
MIANGEQTEVELVLFRRLGMKEQQFSHDAGLVRKDLASLKSVLESL